MLKSLLLSLTALTSLSATNVMAQTLSSAEKTNIRRMAQDFYLKQAEKQASAERTLFPLAVMPSDDNHCEDDGDQRASCVSTLCKSSNCSGSTGREIAEACRGANGRCVEKLCESSNCSGSTGREIAGACRGSNGLCVDELCKTSNCSGSTGREIATACKGADGLCVVELCKSSNCSGSTGKEIARSCGGN